MESTALALSNNREITPGVWQMVKEMAPAMHQSRLFGVSSVDQAIAVMLKGYEIGLGFTASFELIQVVQGRPALSPRGALALLHNHPAITKLDIKRLTDPSGKFLGYECTMARNNGFSYTASWTMADAQRAGLNKPDSGWQHYPENMCMWRAIGFAADVVAPDVCAGMTGLMKMPEKFGVEINDEGEVIDVQASPAQETIKEAELVFSLDDLLNLFGAEKILAINEGRIPGTDEEVQTVALKLVENK
jgi:hypothetical protein